MEQRLIAAQPKESAVQSSLAKAFAASGDLLAEMGKNAESRESYQNGLRIVDGFLAGNTNDQKAAEFREQLRRKLAP